MGAAYKILLYNTQETGPVENAQIYAGMDSLIPLSPCGSSCPSTRYKTKGLQPVLQLPHFPEPTAATLIKT